MSILAVSASSPTPTAPARTAARAPAAPAQAQAFDQAAVSRELRLVLRFPRIQDGKRPALERHELADDTADVQSGADSR